MRRIGGSIRVGWLRVVASAVVLATVLATGVVGAPAFGATRSGGLFGSLVVPSAESFLGGQQAAEEAARRANPEAVAARQLSRTAFAHIPAAGVGRLLGNAFPGVIKHPTGGTPPLPAGTHVVGYPSTHAIQLSLPGHQIGILESTAPVAKRASHGHFAPINLSLTTTGSGYAPANSTVTVAIPRLISAGISTPQNGVSLTPVDPRGHGFTGVHGGVVGASVVYPNTQTSTDTVVKPTSTGFQLDAVLRSADSPQKLYFRVGAPAGSKLAQDATSGVARVVLNGATLATILPPAAEDAAGTAVPSSMSVVGHTVVVSVEHRAGSYLYPVYVDPEINDSQLVETTGGKRSNWRFESSNEAKFGHKAVYEGPGKEHLETTGIAEYKAAEVAYWFYETNGNSKIYEWKTKTAAKNKLAKIESILQFQTGTTGENQKVLSNEFEFSEYTERAVTICGRSHEGLKLEQCLPASGEPKNLVRFQQSATASPGANFKFSDSMSEGIVSISEPAGEHSTTSFNTTSPEVEGVVEGKTQKRVNALYGSGIWLTKSNGALQPESADPGIGVATTRLEYEKSAGSWEKLSEHHYLETENACQGVQCYATHSEYWTVDPKLPDGEDKIRYRAEEAIAGTVSPEGETASTKTVKVDTAKPHNIFLSGLPFGNELSEKAYKLSATAVDGTGTTVASSGIKRIALFVSGTEVAEVGTQTGCSVSKGECTAKAEWSINGTELGAGHHAIVIVATDNAGNEARAEETISIRHSTPVSMGPGSVDLQSGDFALGASDIAMGSGLNLDRSYSSRALEAGDEGPLGPQWSLNLGITESVVEMVDGSVLLTDGKGQQVVFAALSEGKFESPQGDSNLTLKLEENKTTKEKLAYYLEDLTKQTKTKFTLPSGGSKTWVPSKQEGTVATDTVGYTFRTVESRDEFSPSTPSYESQPFGITLGPDGNLWFADLLHVGKITRAGAVTEYVLPTEGGWAESITPGPDGNLWFSTTSKKIGKITTSGTITEYSLPAETNAVGGLVAGPDGNMWFTDHYSFSKNGIGKITPSGTVTVYGLASGSNPVDIVAGPDGNLWFTETEKVAKITTSGTITPYSMPTWGKWPNRIVSGTDGNLWFTNTYGEDRVSKITTSGVVTGYSPPTGSEPSGITVGLDGNVWFVDTKNSKVGKVTKTGVFTVYALPTGSEPERIAAGPDGKMWFTNLGTKRIGTITTSGGTITEPTEVLAPVPAGVSCTPMKQGCRALKLYYAEATDAKGENQSEWGAYKGRLLRVFMEAYDPVSKEMKETEVAEYLYDKLGRLRAEWDPRVSPALKTTYGYDEEGHITALNPPGQEPWAFTYGTIVGDAGTGRLLKVARAPASEALWSGEVLKNTETPTITGSPVVGVRMAVSNGKWSGTPATYGYQWMGCAANGGCTPILGANNANYTPTIADLGHTLVALVTATNGGGSTVASAASSKVEMREFTEYGLPSGSAPYAVAAGPDGNMWFTNNGKSKIGKVTSAGSVTEYALPSSSEPRGIVAGPDGNLWFVDWGTNEVGKITTSGTITEYALPAGSNPQDITVGPDSNLWFTDWTSKKIGKITTSGTITEYAAPSNPYDITKGPDGNLWFTMPWSEWVGKITTSGTVTKYSSTPAGSEPYGIVTGSDGNLWFTDHGTNKVDKITTGGTVTAYALAAGSLPQGIASGVGGNLYVTEYGACKIAKVTTGGTVTEYASAAGSGPYGVASGPDENLWVANNATSKILRFNPNINEAGISEGSVVTPKVGITLEYGVPLSGSGLPTMTSGEVAKWGQSDDPVEATAIMPPDAVQGWPASSYTRASIYYMDSRGRTVNVANPSTATYGSVATTEYNELNEAVRTLSPDNRQTALEAGGKSIEVAKLLDTESKYNEESEEPGTQLIDTLGPQHQVKYMAGSEQKESLARLHTKYFYNEGAPSGRYNLVTKVTTLAQLANEEEVEVRKTTTSYSGQSNLGWTLRAPTSVTVDPEGKKLTSTTLYNSATAQITETRNPAGSGGESAHDVRLIYYTAAANTEGYSACGSHPEWAGLVCETLPAKQPASGPKLPVTITTYNVWNEPEVTTETFGSTVRTKKQVYDGAGRLKESETTSTANTALPKVVYEYDSKTGVLEKRSTTVEGKTKTVTSKYDKLGYMTEYIDADGNTATYAYGSIEKDSLLEKMKDNSLTLGLGEQTYTYNSTTKLMEKLKDTMAGTFTAVYDAEGHLTSEVYPNGMCANDTYNSVGEATHIEYIKTTTCTNHEAPVWYSETRNSSVRGETLNRTSTLASETYAYDTVGRLTETQETPAGEGCSVRLYAYDEESNRTSQTARTPGTGGKCATEGGTVQGHTYDEGNHLSDSGVAYDAFGNMTNVPATDAEGHELASTFYVDNAVATQTQNGVTSSYQLDPEGRVRETTSGGKTTISHYDASGEAVAWTSVTGEENVKRNIPGIDGTLAATETNLSAPVLQLHDLQGNIVATAALSTSETKLLSTYNSTEFGVPNAEKAPPTFAWLGAAAIASALPSGVITYGATSYVPQIGRALQSEAVDPPGAPGGTGAGTQYNSQVGPWVMQGAAAAGAEAPGREAAREQAAMEAAVSGEDPPVWWIGNLEKARSLGETYAEMESTAVVLNTWDLPGDFVELLGKVTGDLVSQFDDAFKWLYDAGQKLIKCSHNHRKLHECGLSYAENVYTFEVPLVKVGFTAIWPNFSVEPRVWECEFGGWTNNGNRWDDCSYEVHIDTEL